MPVRKRKKVLQIFQSELFKSCEQSITKFRFQTRACKSKLPISSQDLVMSDIESITNPKMNLPQLPLNLRGKKLAIGMTWGIILLPTCILPNALYFGIRYGSHSLDTGKSLRSLGSETARLTVHKRSQCQPLSLGPSQSSLSE